VSAGLSPPTRKVAIAVTPVPWRPDVGAAPRPVVAIAPALTGSNNAASSIAAIANAANSRPQLEQSRAPHQRARVSAQPRPANIFVSGCVIDRAVMSPSWCYQDRRAAVFAAWPAAWPYDVCSNAKSVIDNGDGAGADSIKTTVDRAATPPEHVFAPGKLFREPLKCPRPKHGERSGRAGTCFLSPVSFLRLGESWRRRT